MLCSMRLRLLLAGISAGLLASCGPSSSDRGFASAAPDERLRATAAAAESGDHEAIGPIIEQLDSDDVAVRFVAINALEHLTGRTYGYRYDDPPYRRREAINRWVMAMENGELATDAEDVANASKPEHDLDG